MMLFVKLKEEAINTVVVFVFFTVLGPEQNFLCL